MMRQKLKTVTNGKGSSETATPYRNGLKLGRIRFKMLLLYARLGSNMESNKKKWLF